MEEIWKDIEKYEGIYQVSNLGRVKRLPTTVVMRNQSASWEQRLDEYVFTPCLDSHGYPQVLLSIGGKRTARVHRLVAEAFLPKPSDELVINCLKVGLDYVLVNHKDSNPTNNNVVNLEWCSPSFNCDWTVESGNHNTETMKGSLNCNAQLNESDVLEIVSLLRNGGVSQESLATKYGVKQITISNIWTGRSWSWLTGIPHRKRGRLKKVQSASIAEGMEVH